jgi:hypothetical protein
MRIALKAKPERLQQFKLRIPESLKALIDMNRKLADERGKDYNATVVDALTRFNHDLRAQLTGSGSEADTTVVANPSMQAGTNSGTKVGTANGALAAHSPDRNRNQ